MGEDHREHDRRTREKDAESFPADLVDPWALFAEERMSNPTSEPVSWDEAQRRQHEREARRINAVKLEARRRELLAQDPPASVLAQWPTVLAALEGVPDLTQRAWLSKPQPLLAGRTPVQALRDGDVDDVRAEASRCATHRRGDEQARRDRVAAAGRPEADEEIGRCREAVACS
jgi:hypothetical protein